MLLPLLSAALLVAPSLSLAAPMFRLPGAEGLQGTLEKQVTSHSSLQSGASGHQQPHLIEGLSMPGVSRGASPSHDSSTLPSHSIPTLQSSGRDPQHGPAEPVEGASAEKAMLAKKEKRRLRRNVYMREWRAKQNALGSAQPASTSKRGRGRPLKELPKDREPTQEELRKHRRRELERNPNRQRHRARFIDETKELSRADRRLLSSRRYVERKKAQLRGEEGPPLLRGWKRRERTEPGPSAALQREEVHAPPAEPEPRLSHGPSSPGPSTSRVNVVRDFDLNLPPPPATP